MRTIQSYTCTNICRPLNVTTLFYCTVIINDSSCVVVLVKQIILKFRVADQTTGCLDTSNHSLIVELWSTFSVSTLQSHNTVKYKQVQYAVEKKLSRFKIPALFYFLV